MYWMHEIYLWVRTYDPPCSIICQYCVFFKCNFAIKYLTELQSKGGSMINVWQFLKNVLVDKYSAIF